MLPAAVANRNGVSLTLQFLDVGPPDQAAKLETWVSHGKFGPNRNTDANALRGGNYFVPYLLTGTIFPIRRQFEHVCPKNNFAVDGNRGEVVN